MSTSETTCPIYRCAVLVRRDPVAPGDEQGTGESSMQVEVGDDDELMIIIDGSCEVSRGGGLVGEI